MSEITNIDDNTITIGIPTYNRPEYLKTIIKCLQEQTYKNIRILISDNASDKEKNVGETVNHFIKDDSRISYFRQDRNLGAIRNMLFLLDQAKTNYFIWMADDDDFEDEFLEELHTALSSSNKAIVAISGVDIVDQMTTNTVKFDITHYLQQLPAERPFDRLKTHITQPAEWGKARIFFGLCKTKNLKISCDEVMKQGGFSETEEIFSMKFPLDMQLLANGDLIVVPKILFHVNLLPSSNGLREGDIFTGKEIELFKMSYEGYRSVIKGTSLQIKDKELLINLINKAEQKDLIRMLPFYFIKKHAPWLARILKKVYFALFVRR